jgi:hypothetical protein
MSDLLVRLERSAAIDLGDFFEFDVLAGATELVGPPLGGYQLRVEARLDGRHFDRFPLDVGQGDVTVREPDWVPAQVDLGFAGLSTPLFPLYPLEDHFAEKLHAYTMPRENPSRVKDLIDMVLLLDLGLEASRILSESIEATFARYGRHSLPEVLPEPPPQWSAPFEKLAYEVDLSVTTPGGAYDLLRAFLEAS